ncbi:hypothetical protein NN561_011716 [Cricetulus griseus]
MEVLESGEQSVLQWDRKLSELSEPGETEALMYHTVRTRCPGRGASGKRRALSPAGDPGAGSQRPSVWEGAWQSQEVRGWSFPP